MSETKDFGAVIPAHGYAGDIPPALAWQWVQAGNAVLVDVRTKDEFDHAPSFNARNIPYNELRNVIPSLPPDGTFFISHQGGKRSELAAHLFCQAGLNAFVIKPPAAPVEAEKSAD